MGQKPKPKLSCLAKTKARLAKRLHILQWLPKYTRNDVFADFIAGITVGLTMMPQSIAYAGLAGLEPQYGLYTAFIGSFTYIFVGTIKEVSIGPTSLMSLLTFSYTAGKPIEFIILLSFIAGCVELLMGLFKLGFMVDFISPCLTSGFTSASAIIIMAAQLKNLFGVEIHSHQAIGILREFFEKYKNIKMADCAMGFSCIALLIFFKIFTKIKVSNKSLKKSLWVISISTNAIVVLIATLVSAYFDTNGKPPFKITGNVPKGVPRFQFPSFSAKLGNETLGLIPMMESLGTGLFVIPLVGVLTNVAIAKSYSADTVVDASQEMISLGLCNIFGSFVRAMPSSGAFTRSSVASSSDVRTPVQGLYSGTLIVLALSFLAPYFYYIPKASLAAVLITAVSSLIDYKILPVLWRCNKVDFFLTLMTFVIGILLGVEAAIVIGCLCNLVVLLKLWARPKIMSEIRIKSDTSIPYLYIKPELGLYYPGADYLSEFIKKTSRENPDLPIVLDCKNLRRLDYAATKILEYMLKTYNEEGTSLMMINMETDILQTLKAVANTHHLQFCTSEDEISEIIINSKAQEEEKQLLLDLSLRKSSLSKKLPNY